MNFLEKDLEEIIYHADKKLLADRGLTITGKLKRQLKIGNYGICDLVEISKDEKIEINIIELKQNEINVNSFMQAIGYLRGAIDFLERKRNYNLRSIRKNYCFAITLIGRKINFNDNFCYLTKCLNSDTFTLRVYTYDYDIDGIIFNEHDNYSLIDNGFNNE